MSDVRYEISTRKQSTIDRFDGGGRETELAACKALAFFVLDSQLEFLAS